MILLAALRRSWHREESLGADGGGKLRSQELDRDLAGVLEVLGEIHRGHAALAQLPLEAVAVGEGGSEVRGDARHAIKMSSAICMRYR